MHKAYNSGINVGIRSQCEFQRLWNTISLRFLDVCVFEFNPLNPAIYRGWTKKTHHPKKSSFLLITSRRIKTFLMEILLFDLS